MSEKVKKPFFKRVWFWLLAVVVVIIVAASVGGGDSESASSEDKITDEKATDTATKETSAKEEEKAPEKEPVKVYEDNQVKISYKEVNTDGVKFLVENKTDKTLTIQSDSIAVNGFSSNDILMSEDISPKSKGYATAMTSELAEAGTPKKISGKLQVIDMASTNMDTTEVNFTDVKVN
ncbi:hypothetical protein MOC12_21165 [Bacillus spizizenii]|nr:hypothetical protein [Bacillus spizizenii]